MGEVARGLAMTYADYLARERTSVNKHEYVNGEAYAMSRGSSEHGRLAMSLGRELGNALVGRPCVVMSSDVRVRVVATGRATYPDLSVVCGATETNPDDPDAVTNPTVIVEVLSPTSEASDRGDKFAHYRRIPSLREYVLLAQDVRRIEVFRRQGDTWVLTESGPGQTITLPSLGATLSVDAIYADPRQARI